MSFLSRSAVERGVHLVRPAHLESTLEVASTRVGRRGRAGPGDFHQSPISGVRRYCSRSHVYQFTAQVVILRFRREDINCGNTQHGGTMLVLHHGQCQSLFSLLSFRMPDWPPSRRHLVDDFHIHGQVHRR